MHMAVDVPFAPMKLSDYLAERGETMAAFGARVGTTHSTVSKWCAGTWPSPPMLVKIHAATDGRVTPNDWLPAPVEAAA